MKDNWMLILALVIFLGTTAAVWSQAESVLDASKGASHTGAGFELPPGMELPEVPEDDAAAEGESADGVPAGEDAANDAASGADATDPAADAAAEGAGDDAGAEPPAEDAEPAPPAETTP